MAKLTLNDITAGYGSNDLLNANFTAIEEAIENTVSRDGTTPNSMSADLDMNGNAILNVKATNGNENFIWRGNWASSTAYTANNLVYVTLVESPTNGGSTYICTTAHTSSGSFDSDIANWSLLAAQGEDGAPGAGTGDVVGPAGAIANNIATYDGTTGKLIKDSGYGVVDEDDMVSDSATKVPTQQSVKAYVDNYSVPAGTIIYYAANTPPTGYLKANGAEISRTTYADLFSAIGTTFGVGDGSTTFAIPDLRGEFLRGWDDSRGVDSGRTFGSTQADEVKSHTHANTKPQLVTLAAAGASYNVVNGFLDSNAYGGAETRPRNIAMLACIKY